MQRKRRSPSPVSSATGAFMLCDCNRMVDLLVRRLNCLESLPLCAWVLPLCSVAAYALAHRLHFEGLSWLHILGSVADNAFTYWLHLEGAFRLPLLGFVDAYAFAWWLLFEGAY